jgi:hypothetical protein
MSTFKTVLQVNGYTHTTTFLKKEFSDISDIPAWTFCSAPKLEKWKMLVC